ncbi:DUF2884 family protein [Luteimonas salinilitoris]|uniref:DUF2884 family protein n=1 Tax=Luteimonas salinilitoris TaxID=3237697 RepID=A0ABV4HPP6_9GAMM
MPFRHLHAILVAAGIAVAAAACTPPTTMHVEGTRIRLGGDGLTVELRNADGDRALIGADGTLAVDGKDVAVTPAQAALLREYHGELAQLREAALAIAGQGAALGGKAVSEAIKGILKGDPDGIEQRVDAEAEKIEQEAEKIEARAEALKLTQRRLAQELPQLRSLLPGDFDPIAAATVDDGGD